MKSNAKTVGEYLASLPPERRSAIETVRNVILENLDEDYEEGMDYGAINYVVPHRVFPAGYHADPKRGLPFAALASQKNYMSVYLMGLYCGCIEGTQDTGARPLVQDRVGEVGQEARHGEGVHSLQEGRRPRAGRSRRSDPPRAGEALRRDLSENAVSSTGHVPEHQDPFQFRAACDGRGDSRRLIAVREETLGLQ